MLMNEEEFVAFIEECNTTDSDINCLYLESLNENESKIASLMERLSHQQNVILSELANIRGVDID